MRSSSRLAGLILVAVLAGAGCYTVLRHPAPLEMTEDDHAGQRACADCHADDDLYDFTSPNSVSWYGTYPAPWAYYYDTPWWYDDYWYYPSDPHNPGDHGDAEPEDRSGRNLWTRPPGGGPGWLPSQGTPQDPAPVVTQPDNTKPDDKPGNDSDKNDKDKQEKKEKEKRKLWRR